MESGLKAIAEPRRQEIIRLVWSRERPAGEIAKHFDVSRPAISKHLRVLKEAGLVEERHLGTKRLYRAKPEPILEMRRFLESFWDEGLMAIKQAAEAGSTRKRATMSQSSDIVREVRIEAPPHEVFPFFTDPDKMIVWKAVEATLDPRPGGIFRINVTGRDVARGEYVEIDPPRRLVFTFGWETEGSPEPPGSTIVEVTLVPDGEGTLLRLVHSGVPEEIREGSAEGWDHYLPRLVVAAEGREPGPDPWVPPEMANEERNT